MSELSRYREHIGRTAPPLVLEVERGHVRRFVEAIGDTNPIYVDEPAARAAGFERIPAPPTFATALRPPDPRQGLDIDFRKVLHAEQEFVFARPIFVGDRLTVQAKIVVADVKAGRSGVMDRLVVETGACDEKGAPVYVARSTVMVRR